MSLIDDSEFAEKKASLDLQAVRQGTGFEKCRVERTDSRTWDVGNAKGLMTMAARARRNETIGDLPKVRGPKRRALASAYDGDTPKAERPRKWRRVSPKPEFRC
jgi:hypothetical protein